MKICIPSSIAVRKAAHTAIISHRMQDNSSIKDRLCLIVQLNNRILDVDVDGTATVRSHIAEISNMSIHDVSSDGTMFCI